MRNKGLPLNAKRDGGQNGAASLLETRNLA
jgi:hypothetical protein